MIDITDVVYNRNKAFIGLVSRKSERKQKGKRQKHSPFEGVEGVQRKREKSKFFMACTKIGTLYLEN